jgi:uncharacterized protein
MRTRIFLTLSFTLACLLAMNAFLAASSADTRVADAAMQGDKAGVRTLLKQGVDVNVAHGDGMTALHWAAYKDDFEMAQMLIAAGANVGATTRINSMTPLFWAAQNGNAALIQALAKAGANVNATLTTGATPLMYAARGGSSDAIKALVDLGANVNARESGRNETALMFAAANNRAAAIRTLMKAGANASLASKVFDVAAKLKAEASTRGARGAGGANLGTEETPPKIDTMGGLTALLLAARQGHVEAAGALIESGANINEPSPSDKTSPLLIATINGHYDLASFLLDRGADPRLASNAGATPLYTTINVKWAPKTDYPQPDTRQEKTSYLELLNKLLDHGADPNARLKTELWYSGYNFELSQVDTAGATALWRAAQASDAAAMRLLIARGADPLLSPTGGVSPLLVAAGAGVHGNDEVTATGSWLPGLTYLVNELHLDVNRSDDKGFTALHYAAARGDNDMILFLVANGARPDAVAKNGQTVSDVANGPRQRIQPFQETLALLSLLGARNSHKCVSC